MGRHGASPGGARRQAAVLHLGSSSGSKRVEEEEEDAGLPEKSGSEATEVTENVTDKSVTNILKHLGKNLQ